MAGRGEGQVRNDSAGPGLTSSPGRAAQEQGPSSAGVEAWQRSRGLESRRGGRVVAFQESPFSWCPR